MLNTFLSFFIIFFIIYGIEGFGEFCLRVKVEKQQTSSFFCFFSSVGVFPEEIFARVNDTFKLSCAVQEAEGELNFYDNDGLVPSANIKVKNKNKARLSSNYNHYF